MLSLACYGIGAISMPISGRLAEAEVRVTLARFEPRCVVLPAGEVVLVAKPLSHAGGLQTQLLPSLRSGARVVLATRPPAATAAALILEHGVSECGLLASDPLDFVDHLETHRLALPSLRRVIGSGDTVPLELQERFHTLFGWSVLEGCGMTEVGGSYAMQPVHGERKQARSVVPPPAPSSACFRNREPRRSWLARGGKSPCAQPRRPSATGTIPRRPVRCSERAG